MKIEIFIRGKPDKTGIFCANLEHFSFLWRSYNKMNIRDARDAIANSIIQFIS